MEKIEHINYIKAPISNVYEALVTQEGLGRIWTTELVAKPELNFVNEFYFDDEATKMKIVELVENKKIVWECISSDPEWIGTSISFDLSGKDGITSVVLRHENWRKLTEYYRWCNYNWAMFLLSLKEYCEDGTGTPYQERHF